MNIPSVEEPPVVMRKEVRENCSIGRFSHIDDVNLASTSSNYYKPQLASSSFSVKSKNSKYIKI
jgi:hypothetical protein